MIGHRELREKYLDFFQKLGHVKLDSAPLVLQNDATTLFTSSGMQPLVPYLLGQKHPQGSRLVDIQPCVRVGDIEEVGDNRHDTFFEMLGNWSLGDYFKNEQIAWCLEFLTQELNIPISKLHVTVFEGEGNVSKDVQSADIWTSLGIPENRIYNYGAGKNWWSRSGTPDAMPVGEIGGPDTEVFYEFDQVKHDKKFGENCHPNCDCGRFMEICNSVFIQYKKDEDGQLSLLPKMNVDFGGGLERLLAASNDNPDIFTTDVFAKIVDSVESVTGRNYDDADYQSKIRVIADHIKTATMIISCGVVPSNKEQGYVLRRLLRRSIVKMKQLSGSVRPDFSKIVEGVFDTYNNVDEFGKYNDIVKTIKIIDEEVARFASTIERGLKYFEKLEPDQMSSQAFNLFQSYGFPFEITQELALQKGVELDRDKFVEMQRQHSQNSKKTSSGVFKGGLADHSEQVVKYHTATHLIHQALKDVLGENIRQEGSNITGERLRFDFHFDQKISDTQVMAVEKIVNDQIGAGLPVFMLTLPKQEAEKLGASSFFKEKYGETVSVYCIGGNENDPKTAYSKEFCGGPHVTNTKDIGKITIQSVKKIGADTYRLYAKND